MKEHILSQTSNVKAGLKALNYLVERPVGNMVGLGLIWGPPGIGKTHFAMRMCLQRGFVYTYLTANDTPKVLVRRILESVLVNYGLDDQVALQGSTSNLFQRLKDVLNNNTTEGHTPIIFIDEIDYAFGRSREVLFGTIRDIVDHTAAVVMLIGMGEAREKLLKLNRHYFARCNYFCNFKPITGEDAKLICNDISDVELDEGLISFIASSSNGDIRNVIKMIYDAEKLAEQLGRDRVGLRDYEMSARAV